MSLLFGRLTQDFISFSLAVTDVESQPASNTTAQAILNDAAKHFRHEASMDASYLVYIGERLRSVKCGRILIRRVIRV